MKKVSDVRKPKGYRIVYCLFPVSRYDDVADGCGDDVLLFDNGEVVGKR